MAQSGFRVTCSFFVPVDANDPDEIIKAGAYVKSVESALARPQARIEDW